MYQNLFEEIGLSPNEARVYENLLGEENFSVPSLSKKIGIHRRNVYDALDRLAKKNFVEKNNRDGIIHFRPKPPRELLQFLKSKERKFSEALPDIERLYKCRVISDESSLQHGEKVMDEFLLVLSEVKKEFFAIGPLQFWVGDSFLVATQQIRKNFSKQLIPWRVCISVQRLTTKQTLHEQQTTKLLPNVVIHDGCVTLLTKEDDPNNIELIRINNKESIAAFRSLVYSFVKG